MTIIRIIAIFMDMVLSSDILSVSFNAVELHMSV